MSKLNLTEATMLALQGKLEESKPAGYSKMARKLTKKQENIDINVDEKTAVSVMGNETIVDTEDATIIVDKKEDEFVPETSTDLPMEAPEEEEVVEVPVEGDETIIPEDEVSIEQIDEIPVEQADEDSAVLDAEADVDLPLDGETGEDADEDDEEDEDKEESKKVESKKLNEDRAWTNIEDAILDATENVCKEFDVEYERYTNLEMNEAIKYKTEDGTFYVAVEELDMIDENKETKKEAIDENAYKSTNLFKALCDEITDIVVEDDEQPTQEQIETAVDTVINGYDYIWEDLHTALRTEIDKVTGKGDGDEYRPRYEAKSHRKSLGKVTENTVKYSSKTFKEALNKFYTSNTKTIESAELTKFDMTKDTIKMEAKLTNKDGMTTTKILEMKQVAKNKNFTKYSMQEVSRLKTENKSNITMLVATNKDNILECKYIRK